MKDFWNKKMAQRAFYLFLALGGVVVLYYAIDNIPTFMSWISAFFGVISPFVVGIIIAYLFNPLYKLFRQKVFGKLFKKTLSDKKDHTTAEKMASIISTYVVILGVIAFLLYIVIPQLIESVTELVSSIPSYYENFVIWADETFGFIIGDSFLDDVFTKFTEWILKFIKSIKLSDLTVIKDITVSITSGVVSFFVGLIASIYMLYNKEKLLAQTKKAGFAIFTRKFMLKLQRFFGESHMTLGNYISGVVTDALIVGCLTIIVSVICNIPYALLIGVLVGITNIIPYFGPFIGGIPSVLIVLVIEPIKAIWLIVILVVVQQLDSNLITPRVVGQKTGMPAMWVMFSIILCGGLFGIFGMILAVPICSVLFSVIRRLMNRTLKTKRLPTESDDYIGVKISQMASYRTKKSSANDKNTAKSEDCISEDDSDGIDG